MVSRGEKPKTLKNVIFPGSNNTRFSYLSYKFVVLQKRYVVYLVEIKGWQLAITMFLTES